MREEEWGRKGDGGRDGGGGGGEMEEGRSRGGEGHFSQHHQREVTLTFWTHLKKRVPMFCLATGNLRDRYFDSAIRTSISPSVGRLGCS